jgi:hypothetical protein
VPPQLVCPRGHTTTQAPATHRLPAAQALPHAPQLASSRARSRHTPPQLVRPAAQVTAQPPATHTCPAAHACPAAHEVPHAPQFVRSVARSRQTPMQLVKPAPQVVWHAPRKQSCPNAHRTPQAPQWSRSELRSTHSSAPASETPPSARDTGQGVSDIGQAIRHWPDWHEKSLLHALPHAPQWSRSARGAAYGGG